MAKRRPRFDALEGRLCLSGTPTLQTTINLPTSGSWTSTSYQASPIYAVINGHNDLIEVTSGAQLVAYAENSNGSATPVVTYKVPSGVADIKSTPIVVTDPATGQQDLFAAMGRDENQPTGTLEDGRLFGWNLQTGQLLPAFANGVQTGTGIPTGDGLGGAAGVYGALTTGDLQPGSDEPDIVVTTFSSNVMAVTLQGQVLWSWTNDDSIESGAVVGDINRDGIPDIVVGGDSSNNGFYQSGGWVNVLNGYSGTLEWRHFIPGEVTWSSPVLADLDNNGYLDIVIGTGLNYQRANSQSPGTYPNAQVEGDLIYALDPFGNVLPGWPYATTTPSNPQPHEVLGSLAVADMLGNGRLDVVALDRAGFLHVIQPDGQDLPGFAGGKQVWPSSEFGEPIIQSQISDDFASPSIADVTGGGTPDIIATAGPFIAAFNNQGNEVWSSTGSTASGLDSFGTTPAIGNFDGSGGLTMAVLLDNPSLKGVPDQVQVYRLPTSNLTPPWPEVRKSSNGVAVARSAVFDADYVASTFLSLTGSVPNQPTLNLWDNYLNTNVNTLLSTAEYIATSTAARDYEVTKVFQAFLGRSPSGAELTTWANYLGTNTYRGFEILVASGGPFAARYGNSTVSEIAGLYRAILGRTPTSAETNSWLASGKAAGSIATSLLNGSEATADQLKTFYAAAFGAGAQNNIPADAYAAYLYEIHQGVREEDAFSNILAGDGNYAATTFLAGYIEDVYRDVLHRVASPSEDAYWIGEIDTGAVALNNFAAIVLNSTEAREDYVEAEFQALLGRSITAATAASFANYANREQVVITIVGSPEYYEKNGGTPADFVVAAFRDLGATGLSQNQIGQFVNEIDTGTSTATIAHEIIYQGDLYFLNTIVQELQAYLPSENLGVLRTAQTAPYGPNPPTNLIDYCLGLQEGAGYSDEQVIATLLVSPTYEGRVSYYEGIYQSPGIREGGVSV